MPVRKKAPEDLTAKKALALEVIDRLKKEYPDAGCTLDYDHAWQLLVSVRLAAQCTDARVNIVVEDLFAKYPNVAALAAAEPEDIVSAYQKSMRGSDPDAALHYLARLLEAGDLPSACRRLMVCACEDVGLAYPQIIPIVKAAIDAANMVGLPEARLPLADAVILVATSPKSNSAHDAINAAIADVQAGRTGPIPRQLQNKHYDGEDALVKGQNYKYAHDYDHHWVEQQYLPDAIKDVKYYTFGDNKNEQAARAYWAKIKGEENV